MEPRPPGATAGPLTHGRTLKSATSHSLSRPHQDHETSSSYWIGGRDGRAPADDQAARAAENSRTNTPATSQIPPARPPAAAPPAAYSRCQPWSHAGHLSLGCSRAFAAHLGAGTVITVPFC